MTIPSNSSLLAQARLLHEAQEQLGWKSDPTALAEKVRQLDLGLPAEDEFSMLISWMGKCKLVHKLDQLTSPPQAKDLFKIPDLFAIFEREGKSVPVFIEVKVSESQSLSWRSDYLQGLKRYGHEIGIPVLVAWKWKPLGYWMLFDLSHFSLTQTNYKVDFKEATKNSLMGVLAGDFHVVWREGVGFHTKIRKTEKVEESREGDTVTENWNGTIVDAYFTNGVGERLTKLEGALWRLLLLEDTEEITTIEEEHVQKSFVIPPDAGMQMAQLVLPGLLALRRGEDIPIRWREVLQNHEIPLEFSELRESAVKGIDEKIVQYILDYLPNTSPLFIKDILDVEPSGTSGNTDE